jgi:hypothetical protein
VFYSRVNRINEDLLRGWVDQAQEWTPNLQVAEYRDIKPTTQVVLIPLSKLRFEKERTKIERIKFHYLLVDESHFWVRSRKDETSQQLLFYRNRLLPRSHATFHLTATAFPYTMKFDTIETIKSLATDAIRANWTFTYRTENGTEEIKAYGDAALEELRTKWEGTPTSYKSQMLIPILMRRTRKSKIDGELVLPDHFGNLKPVKDGTIDIAGIQDEIRQRNQLLDDYYKGKENRLERYNTARLLAYSSWVVKKNWNLTGRTDRSWWDDFTIVDATEFERGRRLIKILRKAREQGRCPMVFAYFVFHQQFAAKVGSWATDC